jgi:hypothetical protein
VVDKKRIMGDHVFVLMDSGTPGNQDALNLLGESKPIFVHLSEHL